MNTERTTAAPKSATPRYSCPDFAWCTKVDEEHDDDFHASRTIDRWTAATGKIAVHVEAHIPEDGSITPPRVNVEGQLGRGTKDLTELDVDDARRLAHALLAASALAGGAPSDPVSTEPNEHCGHAWCEYGGEGHVDHESAGIYVPATDGCRVVPDPTNGGGRVPMLRVFLQAEYDGLVGVCVNLSGPGRRGSSEDIDRDIDMTVAEARQLRDALDVMLRHA